MDKPKEEPIAKTKTSILEMLKDNTLKDFLCEFVGVENLNYGEEEYYFFNYEGKETLKEGHNSEVVITLCIDEFLHTGRGMKREECYELELSGLSRVKDISTKVITKEELETKLVNVPTDTWMSYTQLEKFKRLIF